MSRWYRLVDKVPVPCTSLEAAQFIGSGENQIAKTVLSAPPGVIPEEITVSTVFLGLDHGWRDQVILFETMTFPGEECHRYSSYDEAIEGHKKVVEEKEANYKKVKASDEHRVLCLKFLLSGLKAMKELSGEELQLLYEIDEEVQRILELNDGT